MKKTRWFIVLAGLTFAAQVGFYFYAASNQTNGNDPAWIAGFRGNILAGLLGSVMFLLLGLFLDDEVGELTKKTSKLTEETKKLSEETHNLVEADARRQDTQRRIDRFHRFFHNESYHDVTFEDLKRPHHPLGLVYTICPLKDEKGQPRIYRTEMQELYIVRVQKIAFEEVLEPEALAEYDGSPIRVGAAYFCEYVNDAWHMGLDSIVQDHKVT